jgi:acetyl esterase/lipase
VIKKTLIFLLISETCLAQQPVMRDTTFTLQSTFEKEVKKRPYIKIVTTALSENVKQENNIAYRHIGNRELLLDIFYPKNTNQKKPAVLLLFGGGWKSGDKSQNQTMAAKLANNGYVAVSAEYRLSPEAIYPAAVYDLKSAIRWMRVNTNKYGIDTSQIAVMGCSAGGQLAALIGATNKNNLFEDTIGNANHSSSVQAVIDIDGILAFKHPESMEASSASLWFGGDYEHKNDLWEQASALNHVDKNTVPFLFLNSSTIRFHAGRDDMIKKMNGFGIYSEVHEFPDTPHPFWFFDPWFEPMMQYTLDFLKKIFKK